MHIHTLIWSGWTKRTVRVCFHESWALSLALSCLSRPRVFTITIKVENERHTWGYSGVCLRFLVFFFSILKLLARGDFCISSCVKHADFWHCPSDFEDEKWDWQTTIYLPSHQHISSSEISFGCSNCWHSPWSRSHSSKGLNSGQPKIISGFFGDVLFPQ